MAEIQIDGDSIRIYDGCEMVEEINSADMSMSDFTMINIGRALALYEALCNMDTEETTVKFV